MKSNATIYAVAIIAVAGVIGLVGLSVTGDDNQAQPMMVVLVGFLGSTVAALVAASKADNAVHGVQTLNTRMNGELDQRMEEAALRVMQAEVVDE